MFTPEYEALIKEQYADRFLKSAKSLLLSGDAKRVWFLVQWATKEKWNNAFEEKFREPMEFWNNISLEKTGERIFELEGNDVLVNRRVIEKFITGSASSRFNDEFRSILQRDRYGFGSGKKISKDERDKAIRFLEQIKSRGIRQLPADNDEVNYYVSLVKILARSNNLPPVFKNGTVIGKNLDDLLNALKARS